MKATNSRLVGVTKALGMAVAFAVATAHAQNAVQQPSAKVTAKVSNRTLLGPIEAQNGTSADSGWAGRGIGTGLLKHALQRCVEAAGLIGGRALMVNAVDEEAAAFWRRRGFLSSSDDAMILFRSLADIAASMPP